MREIDEAIGTLQYTLTLWKEEFNCFGPNGVVQKNGSTMSEGDLKFLEKKIKSLEKLKSDVTRHIKEVKNSVDNRFKGR